MTAIAQSYFMTGRHVRAFVRQPWFLAITIVQPFIWLFLFSALFRNVAEIPGFGTTGSYVDFLTPGVLVMTALFSCGWSGMGMIEDIDHAIMDRFLVSPAHRSSLIVGRIAYELVVLGIEAVIIGGVAFLLGARFEGGILGYAALTVCAMLIGAAFAAISDAMALVVRQRESVIGFSSFLVLPLSFLSAAFMPLNLVPDWIEWVARFNPVNWAVEAGRAALASNPDWSFILPRMGGLAAVTIAAMWLATRAFRSYQSSI
jgi:ABC-2 type transport system permease protein